MAQVKTPWLERNCQKADCENGLIEVVNSGKSNVETSGGGCLDHCGACTLPLIQTSFVDSAGDIKMVKLIASLYDCMVMVDMVVEVDRFDYLYAHCPF